MGQESTAIKDQFKDKLDDGVTKYRVDEEERKTAAGPDRRTHSDSKHKSVKNENLTKEECKPKI